MKKNLLTMFTAMMMLAAMSFTFTACGGSDDDNDNGNSQEQTVKNVLNVGVMEYKMNYASMNSGTITSYYYTSFGFGEQDGGANAPDAGVYITIQVIRTTAGLPDGTYTLAGDASKTGALAGFTTCYKLEGSLFSYVYFKTASFTISKKGSIYTITFTGTDSSDKTIKLTYKGTIRDYTKS